MKISNIILILITIFVGIFVYFYELGSIPNGFYIDEALPGWSANSILLTGKDEWGKEFPLVFRFYGSYNPPLFIYSVVPSIAFFGLNIFAVRFVSALFGLLTAVPLYLLVQHAKVFKTKRIAIISTFFFVLTPWLILHSRIGYEVSLGLLLFTTGVYFLWRGLYTSKYLVWSMFFLSLSTYAAYAERFIVPMFILGAVIVFRRTLFEKSNKYYIKLALLVGVTTQIPNLYILTTPAFFPKSDLFASGFILSQAQKSLPYLPYPVSLVLTFFREVASHFVVYFSPRSLFSLTDPDLQRSIPELSVFYPWMLAPYLAGLYMLYKNRKHNFAKLLGLLLLITPIPASITADPFSTHRALPVLLPLFLVITWGMDKIISLIPSKLAITLGGIVIGISAILLWRSYFVLLPNLRARYWGYGIEQIASFAKNHPNEKIVIDQGRLKPMYAQLAFFMKLSPHDFQKTVPQDVKYYYYNSPDFDAYFNFANIETRNIKWEEDTKKDLIFIGDILAISPVQAEEHCLEKVLEVKDPIGEVLFQGYRFSGSKICNNTDR